MKFRAIQILLMVVCVQQSTSTEIKINARWSYMNNKNSNAKSLPDSIQFDLELERGRITLNLMKQSSESLKTLNILSQFQGKLSVWQPSEDEFLGIYKDPSLDAFATVTVNALDEAKETLYAITFTSVNKSFFLEPANVFSTFKNNKEQDPAVENNIKANRNNINDSIDNSDNSKNEIKFVNIDGRLHSLMESPAKPTLDRDVTKETMFRKRSATLPLEKRLMTVEVFTIIDYSIFNRFFKESKAETNCRKKKDARRKILYIFTHIMERVKNNYEKIEMEGLKFTTKWVGALIAESINDVPFVENENSKIDSHTIDAGSVMENLKEWERTEKAKGNYKTKLPNYDFLAFFTNYELHNNKRSIAGLASTSEICTYQAIGLNRYSYIHEASLVATHEVGHTLGIHHDGLQNVCEPTENFIMASRVRIMHPDRALNLYNFSRCSPSYLNATVNRLDSINNNCLADGGVDFNRGRERDLFLRLYPGQIYEIDDQCRMFNGPESYYCGGVQEDKEICRVVKCFTGSACQSLGRFNALDGTTCANSSWCLGGKCVFDIRAPKAATHCVNGDVKFPPYDKDCPSYGHELDCYIRSTSSVCCASCNGVRIRRKTKKDCIDAIEECSSLEPRDCYNNYYAKTCCQTCRALVQNPHDANCLYGDKGIDCSDFLPTVCHLSPSRFCCQTCAAYLSSTKTIRNNASISITDSVLSSKFPPLALVNNTTVSTKNTFPTQHQVQVP